MPDFTNHNLERFYVQPDFIYKKENAVIFVDGGIHKKTITKADDIKKRNALSIAGYDVLEWDYTSEEIQAFITRRKDIFRKVR